MGFSGTIPELSRTIRTLLFRSGDGMYGCDIGSVREIIPYRAATRLPGAPAYVQGLINLRGTIVTVLDLGARLDAGRAPIRDGSIILAEHGTRVVGVAVDEVMDVQGIVGEPVSDDHPTGLVCGLGHLDDGVVILVDLSALIAQVLLHEKANQ